MDSAGAGPTRSEHSVSVSCVRTRRGNRHPGWSLPGLGLQSQLSLTVEREERKEREGDG